MGCCRKKNPDQPALRRRSCFTMLCRVVLFIILIVNVVWGFTETMTAVIINFIVNHPVGKDGFSNFKLEIRDITYIERKDWDKKDAAVLEPKVLAERNKIAKLRKLIAHNCTLYVDIRESFDKQNCNTANDQERQFDYYCAIVEHPEKYYDAFRPLVFNWLVYNCIFVFLIPIKLVSTCWTGQVVRLLGVYMFLQIIPIAIAISIVYALFPIHMLTVNNETSLDNAKVNPLCALDYLHEGFPIRIIFGIVVAARFGLKVIEGLCVIWFIYTHKAEKRRLALGIPISPKMKGWRKVSPTDDNDNKREVELEPVTQSQVETALTILQKEQEREELAKKAAKKKSVTINNQDGFDAKEMSSSEHLPMDAILPPIVTPTTSGENLEKNDKPPPPPPPPKPNNPVVKKP